jgi:rod shape-determining protein MreB
MLISNYRIALREMREGMAGVRRGGLLARRPQVLVHPMELIDGGVTDLECEILEALALNSGAYKAAVYEGPIPVGEAIGAAITSCRSRPSIVGS